MFNSKKCFSTALLIILSSQIYACSTNMAQVSTLQNNNNSETQQSNPSLSNVQKKSLSFSKVTKEQYETLNGFMSRGLVPNSSSGSSSDMPYAAPSAYASAAPTAAATSVPYTSASSSAIPDGIYSTSEPSYSSGYNPGYYPAPYPMPSIGPSYSSGYYGGSYFGNTFEEYVVSDFEEAKTTGYTGSYLSIIKDVINPIVVGLSTDSRLISTYGNTNKSGVTAKVPVPSPSIIPTPNPSASPDPQATYTPYPYAYSYTPTYQWQFTYVSSAKKEIYSILVSSEEVLVLKQKWKLKELSNNDIKIDSNQAIEIAEKAIKNKNYPAPEYYPNDMATYLYEIPEDANLSYNLAEEGKGVLVWNINITINGYDPDYYYNNGYAKVNAQTGELISFQRIAKMKNNYYGSPTPYAYPYPSITPSVMPTSSP